MVYISHNHLFQTYEEALAKAIPIAGEISHVVSRLQINMAIYWEEDANFDKAFDLFRAWYVTSKELYGIDHPKTKRALDTIREPRYSMMAHQRGMDVP